MSFFSKPRSSLRSVIDLGSHSVKALVFEVTGPQVLPTVVKKINVRLPAARQPERAALKLREVLFSLARELKKIPEEILVGLDSGFGKLSFPIWSAKLLKGKISPQKYSAVFRNLWEEHRSSSEALIANPLEILVNGYGVDPQDFAGDSGELNFRVSAFSIPENVSAMLLEAKRSLGGMPIEITPTVLPEAAELQRLFKEKDFFWIDVGGEHTGCAMVKDGVLAEAVSFPVGVRHFIRGIAKTVGVSFEEAEDLKRQYIQGIVSESTKARLGEFLAGESKFWEEEFGKALDDFYHIGPVPRRIALLGGGANLPEIQWILREGRWLAGRSWVEKSEITVLGAERFFAGNSLGGYLQGPEDAGIAALMQYSIHRKFLF